MGLTNLLICVKNDRWINFEKFNKEVLRKTMASLEYITIA